MPDVKPFVLGIFGWHGPGRRRTDLLGHDRSMGQPVPEPPSLLIGHPSPLAPCQHLHDDEVFAICGEQVKEEEKGNASQQDRTQTTWVL